MGSAVGKPLPPLPPLAFEWDSDWGIKFSILVSCLRTLLILLDYMSLTYFIRYKFFSSNRPLAFQMLGRNTVDYKT